VTFNTVTTFAAVPIGGKFIEAMTTCNEVAIRIEPTTHQDKSVNARRVGGKLIFMVDWEPVFVQGDDKTASSCPASPDLQKTKF
jgi:hypothetical protein